MSQVISKGTIAICSRGRKGLVTSDGQVEVSYEDGTKGMAWTGVHLGPAVLGQPWSSRKPTALQQTTSRQYRAMMALLDRHTRNLQPLKSVACQK
jgi:hypothetical protein